MFTPNIRNCQGNPPGWQQCQGVAVLSSSQQGLDCELQAYGGLEIGLSINNMTPRENVMIIIISYADNNISLLLYRKNG
jgi:hypothetical protein